MENLQTLVLAAGNSTRIAPVAKGLPKPMLAIAGDTVIAHNLAWLRQYGIKYVWINLHFQAHLMQSYLEQNKTGTHIAYLFEQEILGTAGAFANAVQYWPQSWQTALIIYGDNLLRFNLQKFLAWHQAQQAAFSMAVFSRTKHLHTGIAGGRLVIDAQQRIRKFVEQAAVTEDMDLVNAGVYLINMNLVRFLQPPGIFCDFARDFIPELLRNNVEILAYIIETGGFCLGLDTQDSYAKAQAIVRQATTA